MTLAALVVEYVQDFAVQKERAAERATRTERRAITEAVPLIIAASRLRQRQEVTVVAKYNSRAAMLL